MMQAAIGHSETKLIDAKYSFQYPLRLQSVGKETPTSSKRYIISQLIIVTIIMLEFLQ